MSWTRREFLTRSVALGAALTSGCSSAVGGAPSPGPTSTRPASTTTTGGPRAMTMGIMAYQPYTVENGDEATGPVPDVARAVLSKIGVPEVRIELVRQEEQVLTGLLAGQFDLVGGLTIRADLCAQVEYSRPDTVSGTALIVPAGNPKGLKTYAEVASGAAKIAVLTGLPEYQDALKSGVAAANIVRLPVPHQLVDAVRNGQADCAAFDDITARDLVQVVGDGEVVTVAPFPPPGRQPLVGAYAFPQDAVELLEPFNEALRDLHESGEWLTLVEPYGFTAANEPAANLTAEQFCGA